MFGIAVIILFLDVLFKPTQFTENPLPSFPGEMVVNLTEQVPPHLLVSLLINLKKLANSFTYES